jgi:AraC-like DNA-binding protein
MFNEKPSGLPAVATWDGEFAQVDSAPSAFSMLRRPAELHGSEIIRARYDGRTFAPHTHDTWTIGWVTQGANRFRRGRAGFVAGPGELCVVNPGEAHTGGGESMAYWNLMPSDALLSQVFPNTAPDALFLHAAVVADRPTVAAVQQLFRAFSSPRSALAREQAAVDGLVALFRTTGQLHAEDIRRDPVPRAARLAQEFIEAHVEEPIPLARLADEVHLSLFHFCRVFEAAFGMPAAAYVRSQRVKRAAHHISMGASLADAAARCGFADQAHMTRQFRAVLGVTPAQWRA